MANFCTKCGRKLVDGQPCPCTLTEETVQEEQVTYEQPQEEEVQYYEEKTTEEKQDVTAAAKNFLSAILDMIKRPSSGLSESVQDETSKVGLIMMGVEAVLAGLYLYMLVSKVISATMSGISSFTGTSAAASQGPSAGGFLMYGIIITLIASLVVSGLVLGLMKTMGHAEMNWLQSCQIAGFKGLGSSIGWILAILGLVLGLYSFSILSIAVGAVLGFIYFVSAMMSYPGVKKDAVAYVALITMLVTTFVSYFVLKEFVFSSLLNSAGSSLNSLQSIF